MESGRIYSVKVTNDGANFEVCRFKKYGSAQAYATLKSTTIGSRGCCFLERFTYVHYEMKRDWTEYYVDGKKTTRTKKSYYE